MPASRQIDALATITPQMPSTFERGASSWMYDYDARRFEMYIEDRSMASLKDHTRGGEVIIHRSNNGTLTAIHRGQSEIWPEGHHYSIDHQDYSREAFA
ncbi:hypothetical protein [Methylobacterium radiotolerans]|uniref:hypothetical protein n=1 Tax=Methylobacterium radiotolerans TaxID=31998 RepID=UPI001F2DD3A2|nr:hypothetical protein [Methylobacterium radiotolerans]UIY45815.1 hypothetical protein LZ599_32430 [Methylobacterium radiotolerans]